MSRGLRIHHVGIAVPDLDAAIEWYGRVLGFANPERHEIAALRAHMAFVRRGDLRLELWQRAGAAAVPAERREPNSDLMIGGTKHMALAVDDLGSWLHRLVHERVDIAAIQRSPREPMRHEADPLAPGLPPPFAMFIRDPGGTLIELLDGAPVAAEPGPDP